MSKKSYAIGLALSIVFLILFLRKIDLWDIWRIFRSVEYVYTIPLMMINLGTLWVRAKRWKYLLNPVKKIQIGKIYNATAIGFMANNLLPARIGEFVRAYILGSREKISTTASFATIVVERVFDGFTILFLFLVVIFFMPFPPDRSQFFNQQTIKTIGLLSFFFYFSVLVVLLWMRFHHEQANRLIGTLLRIFPDKISLRLSEAVRSFISGLEVLKRFKDTLVVLLYSFFLWIVTGLSVYLLFFAFHIELPVLAAFFLEIILIFGVSIPSAPGYIGTFHWACAAGLIFLGVESNLAKSFAVLLWLVGFIPVTGLGLILLWKEGMSLKGLKKTKIEA